MFRFEEENQLASKGFGGFSGAGCRRPRLQGWTSNETQSDQRQAGVGAVHDSRAERQAAAGCCPEFEVCSCSLHIYKFKFLKLISCSPLSCLVYIFDDVPSDLNVLLLD